MTLLEIVYDYIRSKRVLFSSYVIVCCVGYLVKVLVTSAIYSKLFDKNADFTEVIRQICAVWITLCVLYVVKSRLETILIPDLLGYLRTTLFDRYIRNNEVRFNDSDVSGDVTRILEVTRNIRDIFLWITGTMLPTVALMICINLYFIVKFPAIGAVNLVGNIINYFVIRKYAPPLIENANRRETQFLEMASLLEEHFSNLLNIYLNDKIDDTLKSSHDIEQEYLTAYKQQNLELEYFSIRLKAINYCMAFISMSLLYRTSTDHSQFVNGLLIFTFYLSTLENMSEDVPFSLMTLGNIKNLEISLARKDPNHVARRPDYPSLMQPNVTFH